MATALDKITAALKEIGVIGAGDTPTAEEAADGLVALNRLMDQWAAERLYIYAITRTTWAIVPGQASYTLSLVGNIVLTRPSYVNKINYIDTATNPDTEYQTSILTDDAWVRISQKALTSLYPQAWHYTRFSTSLTLYPWPIPTASGLLGVIYAPQALTEFPSLTTDVEAPPGYRRMIVKNLALELAPSYGRTPDPLIVQQAKEAKEIVKRANKTVSDMSFEAGALIGGSSGAWSIHTGS